MKKPSDTAPSVLQQALKTVTTSGKNLPKQRHCRYCMKPFKPRRIDQYFCCVVCRRGFWAAAGAPVPRVLAHVEKHVRSVLGPLVRELVAAEFSRCLNEAKKSAD